MEPSTPLQRPRWATRAIAVLVWTGTASFAGASEQCRLHQVAAIPVSMVHLRPTVSGKINGKDVVLLVDSGAFFSMLAPSAAATLGLSLRWVPGLSLQGVGGTANMPDVANVKQFSVGEIELQNVDFLVAGNDLDPGVSGLLGQNLLAAMDIEFDFAHGFVRWMKSDHCGDKDLAYWSNVRPSSSVRLEYTHDAHNHWMGEAFLNGKRLRVIFDTGAYTSLLSLSAARRVGVQPGNDGVASLGISHGVGRHLVPTWSARFDSFKIGDEEIHNARLRIGELAIGADMLLGGDFFAAHRVYVAKSQRRLYFTYNGGPVFDLSPARDAAGPAAGLQEIQADLQPRDAAGFASRGNTAASRGDPAGGLLDLDRAIELEPENPAYRYQRALIHEALRQPEPALADLNEAVRLAPADVGALVARAELRLSTDRAAAIDDLNAASRAVPKEDARRLGLARLYARGAAHDEAIAQFDLWLATHREDVHAAEALAGRCLQRVLARRDLDKAVDDCDRSLDAYPRQPELRALRGWALVVIGRDKQALADLDAAVASDANDARSLYARGVARVRLGQREAGRADLQAAKALRSEVGEEAERAGLPPPP